MRPDPFFGGPARSQVPSGQMIGVMPVGGGPSNQRMPLMPQHMGGSRGPAHRQPFQQQQQQQQVQMQQSIFGGSNVGDPRLLPAMQHHHGNQFPMIDNSVPGAIAMGPILEFGNLARYESTPFMGAAATHLGIMTRPPGSGHLHHLGPMGHLPPIPPPPPPPQEDEEDSSDSQAASRPVLRSGSFDTSFSEPGCSATQTATQTSTGASSSHPATSRISIRVVKNDYNQHFVDTGERPQNFIRDHHSHLRFQEYPKLGRLIQLKDKLNAERAHPAVHIQADLKSFNLLPNLGCDFDVILVDPPWREYLERIATHTAALNEDFTPWTLQELLQLQVDKITAPHCFCFIWCGTSHLDDGRALLQAWGFRRCEDICWCKTNCTHSNTRVTPPNLGDDALFIRSKEHCLMGVKGGVRRSVDTKFIHSNIDTDVVIEEEPFDAQGRPTGSTAKPAELYSIIERFCLGRRKLELFGLDRNIRQGWLTIGKDISYTNFDRERYIEWTTDVIPLDSSASSPIAGINGNSSGPDQGEPDTDTGPGIPATVFGQPMYYGGRYVGCSAEIDSLRPKSPPRSNPTTRQ